LLLPCVRRSIVALDFYVPWRCCKTCWCCLLWALKATISSFALALCLQDKKFLLFLRAQTLPLGAASQLSGPPDAGGVQDAARHSFPEVAGHKERV